MKAPTLLDQLDLAGKDVGTGGTYPSLGFQPVWDADLGNGDYYGLYWPYGREDREPIVCDMLHDQWGMEVAFSNVPIFVEWLEKNDRMRGDESVDDPQLVGPRFQQVRGLLQHHPDVAIHQLQQVCEDFPECAEYWYTLAGQLRRSGDVRGACLAAIRAYASNWSFGMPPNGTLRFLQGARGKLSDPLIDCSDKLTPTFGGTKENSNYEILKQCINAYLASADPIPGLLLNQNYAYMMSTETTAFQDRHKFDAEAWLEEHRELCLKHLGDSRTEIA